MSFLTRVSFFIIGVLLGLLILFLSLDSREEPISFNYFPNSRIKSKLMNSDILISEKALCKMMCLDLDTVVLNEHISNAHVDFKTSKIRGYDIKTYYLYNDKKDNFFKFQIDSDSVKLIDFFIQLSPPFVVEGCVPEECLHCY